VPLPLGLSNEDWEYILIEDDDLINAFALPGGKIGVYTGLFKIAKTDSDLAVVIGHEMAHVVAKHGGERMSQQMLALGGSIVLSQATKGDTKEDRERLMKIYGFGSSLGILLPYSRLHEKEADRLGLIYMAQAGYDPRVAIAFWERMEKEKSFHMPEFISTHPSSKTRIMELHSLMDEAMLYYNEY
jgi:predicted Zn-dependent protease